MSTLLGVNVLFSKQMYVSLIDQHGIEHLTVCTLHLFTESVDDDLTIEPHC